MARFTVRRRRETHPPGLAAAGFAAAGLAVGAALGFLVGELLGPRATRVVRSPKRAVNPGKRSVAELVHDAQSAIEADLSLRDLRLEVVPVGRNALELHGWVPNRRTRAAAARLVAAAVPLRRLVNCLLVRGEDDLAPLPDASLGDEAIA